MSHKSYGFDNFLSAKNRIVKVAKNNAYSEKAVTHSMTAFVALSVVFLCFAIDFFNA